MDIAPAFDMRMRGDAMRSKSLVLAIAAVAFLCGCVPTHTPPSAQIASRIDQQTETVSGRVVGQTRSHMHRARPRVDQYRPHSTGLRVSITESAVHWGSRSYGIVERNGEAIATTGGDVILTTAGGMTVVGWVDRPCLTIDWYMIGRQQ